MYYGTLAAGPGSDDWVRVRRFPLLPGWLGVWTTARAMVQLVRGAVSVPAVKVIAVELTAGVNPLDREGLSRAIRDGVRARFRYVFDPSGVEELWSPEIQAVRWRRGGIWGDCDDAAIWTAALARAVGLRTRIVTIANGRRGPDYNHVFAEAEVGPGQWRSMDFLSPDSKQIKRACWPV